MPKLSVVISAFNEEQNIVDCITSVEGIADEIIVVNNSSSDNTLDLSKKFTDKIYTQPNNPMLNVNKNFGFTKASGEWIFCLDADERLTPELGKEIRHVLIQDMEFSGYWVPRKNNIFGKWMEHTGWYPDYQLRLFRKEHGKFPEQFVHEMIALNGKAGYLQEPMLHYNYVSVQQFLQKMIRNYTLSEAELLVKQGKHVVVLDAIRMPFREFLTRYFAQEGYRDGLHGLVLSLLQAFYHLIVFCLVWEKQGFVDSHPQLVFPSFLKETKKMRSELHYWTYTALLLQHGKKLQKTWYRIRRKLLSQQIKF